VDGKVVDMLANSESGVYQVDVHRINANESLVFTYCSSTVSEKKSWLILPDNSIFTKSIDDGCPFS
jgi:hypothetical protein